MKHWEKIICSRHTLWFLRGVTAGGAVIQIWMILYSDEPGWWVILLADIAVYVWIEWLWRAKRT